MAGYKSLIIKRRAEYIAANQAICIGQAKEKKTDLIILHSNIYLCKRIFVKLDNDFNLNIHHLASYVAS